MQISNSRFNLDTKDSHLSAKYVACFNIHDQTIRAVNKSELKVDKDKWLCNKEGSSMVPSGSNSLSQSMPAIKTNIAMQIHASRQ